MDSRAWEGMNLGRSWLSPGAYNIWVPSANKVVTTSDVYFNELSFPWRPNDAAPSALAQAADGDAAQPSGLKSASLPPNSDDFTGPPHLITGSPNVTRP
eukprot:3177382-Pleurochrysis_carterae.AAC.1